MEQTAEIKPANDRELGLTRVLNATPAQLFKAWTTPEIMTQRFAPKPYETPLVEIEPTLDIPARGRADAYLAAVADQRVEKVQTCQCLMQKALAAGADADKNPCR